MRAFSQILPIQMRGGKMKYRNKYTGSVIEVTSFIKGGGWEPVSVPDPEKPKTEPVKPKKTTKKGKKNK